MCSVVVAQGLSCPVAYGILVPRPGIEPVSPALEGGFLTTGPPGKSPIPVTLNGVKELSLSLNIFLILGFAYIF